MGCTLFYDQKFKKKQINTKYTDKPNINLPYKIFDRGSQTFNILNEQTLYIDYTITLLSTVNITQRRNIPYTNP